MSIARGNISQMVSNVSVIRRLQGMLGSAKVMMMMMILLLLNFVIKK